MSDTPEQLILRQRQRQQRQILAMMGIEQWVQPNSPTMNMTSIPLAAEILSSKSPSYAHFIEEPQPTVQSPVSIESSGHVSSPVSHEAVTQRSLIASSDSDDNPVITIRADDIESQSPTEDVTTAVSPWIDPLIESCSAPIKNDDNSQSVLKVAPFDLQGGRYGNWVLLVDIQALNNDSQKLWQNITQALSISCETSSFPICAGMDTAELANASLAGYIFRIGRSEDIKIAVLTALPDGLNHPNFIHVPTLNEILADTTLKIKLWESLSDREHKKEVSLND